MAINQMVKAEEPDVWYLLTSEDVSRVTVQLRKGQEIIVAGTVGETPPDSGSDAGISVSDGSGFKNEDLSDLFPGVPGVNRLYFRAVLAAAAAFVSAI